MTTSAVGWIGPLEAAEGPVFAALAWVLLGTTLLLRKNLSSVLEMGRRREGAAQWLVRREKARRVEVLPQFRLPLMHTQEVIDSRELKNSSTTLLFIDEYTSPSNIPLESFRVAVAAFTRNGTTLYVICSGTKRQCGELSQKLVDIRDVRILLDEDGSVARLFHIDDTPVAFIFDPTGKLVKAGRAS